MFSKFTQIFFWLCVGGFAFYLFSNGSFDSVLNPEGNHSQSNPTITMDANSSVADSGNSQATVRDSGNANVNVVVNTGSDIILVLITAFGVIVLLYFMMNAKEQLRVQVPDNFNHENRHSSSFSEYDTFEDPI